MIICQTGSSTSVLTRAAGGGGPRSKQGKPGESMAPADEFARPQDVQLRGDRLHRGPLRWVGGRNSATLRTPTHETRQGEGTDGP